MAIRKANAQVKRTGRPRFKPVIDLQQQVPSKQARADQLVKGDGTKGSAGVRQLTKATLEESAYDGTHAAQAKKAVSADIKLEGKPKVHAIYDDIEGVDGATMRNNAAWEEYKQGNLAGAEQLLNQALEQEPFPSIEKSIHSRMSAVLMQSPERMHEARDAAQKALDIDPEYGPANFNMACVQAQLGEPELAGAYLGIAKAADSDFFTGLAAQSMSGGALKMVAGHPDFSF